MRTLATTISLLGVLAVLGQAAPASAQVFDETTISFSFADDNVLRDPGETRRNSPDAYFGQGDISSLDRVEGSAYRRTASRLSVYKKFDTGALYPEGALRVRFSPDSDGKYGFADDGTFLKLNYSIDKEKLLYLQLYPIDSDKMRVGYHYDITWGGSNVFPKNFRRGLVPGLKLAYDSKVIDAFVGMKTALIRSPSENILDNPGGNTNQFVERAYYGAMAGFGVEPITGLRLDVSGGYFEKGNNTRSSVLGKKIYSGGGSAQISYRYGGEVGQRMDLRLYYEDPERFPLNNPGRYSDDFGFEVAVEYTRVIQTLEDPDHYASTKNEWSNAGFASLGIRWQKLRFLANAVYRDLSYVVFNVPGFVPYQALSGDADITPELFGVVSVDYFFQSLGLTPALSFGVLLPSTYKPSVDGSTLEGPYAADVAKGIQKTVVRGSNSGDWDILPAGEDELPVLMVKFDIKYNLGANFSVVGEVTYARDSNTAQVFIDDMGHAKRRFDKPDILGFGLVTELYF